MKELNEYKAEIFRRSELKIKKRKEVRTRAIALCVPLCAVVITGVFLLRPMLNSGDTTLSTDSITDTQTALSPGLVHRYAYAEITILGEGHKEEYRLSEPHGVTEVYYHIDRAFKNGSSSGIPSAPSNTDAEQTHGDLSDATDCIVGILPPTAPPSDNASTTEKVPDHDISPTAVKYRITLVESDGSSVSYVLTESTLCDESGRTVTLDEESLGVLYEAIGIKKGE